MSTNHFQPLITKLSIFLILICLLTLNSGPIQMVQAATGDTIRVSVSSSGAQGNGLSDSPSISADGRYIAFASVSSNLVSGDTNNLSDVFVHDKLTGQTTRVSVATNGKQGNGSSLEPSISADGRYVTFATDAKNFDPEDANLIRDIYIHDRLDGQTTRVSVAYNGAPAAESSFDPSFSADGNYLAFTSQARNLVTGDTNGKSDIFLYV